MTKYLIKKRPKNANNTTLCDSCGNEMLIDEFYNMVTNKHRYKCEYCGGIKNVWKEESTRTGED